MRNIPVPELEEIPEIVVFKSNSCIALSRADWDARETSWDFGQSPLLGHPAATLAESYAAWEAAVTRDFYRLHAHEEELNRIFIGIYGLEEELTPEVALKDVTILQEELDRGEALAAAEAALRAQEQTSQVSKTCEVLDTADGPKPRLPIKQDIVLQQWLSYCVGLLMGRYRLGKPGLHIAHPGATAEELAPYEVSTPSSEGGAGGDVFHIDDDGILPLMGADSPFSDDIVRRVTEVIGLVWGEASLPANLNFLQAGLGMDLEKYLCTKFWDYHKKVYKKKPIYWLFRSPEKYFQVLVYLHRLTPHTVQQIRSAYLHPYQDWLAAEMEQLQAREAGLSKAEQKRLDRLTKARVDCRAYDETLKALAAQQIAIDLDDGVTVNLGKFEGAVAKV